MLTKLFSILQCRDKMATASHTSSTMKQKTKTHLASVLQKLENNKVSTL